jgi:predicted secreted protein
MAGTPKPGRLSTLSIGGVAIGGLQDATLDVQRAEIDTTDKDSAGWDEFIPGQGSLSINGTCVYEEDDAGQEDLIDAILAGTTASFVFRPWGASSGADQWTATGFPTSTQLDSPNKEALSFPFTIRLSGAPTRANQ